MVRLLVFLLFVSGIPAQTPPPDLGTLIRDVRSAIGKGDLVTASELANNLDDGVQARLHNWMIRDARQRVAEVLTWIPNGTETLLVDQQPFVIGNTAGRPDVAYLAGRLNPLRGRTVRIAAAAESQIRDRSGTTLTVPATPPEAGVVSFYFLAENLEGAGPGVREQDLLGHPVWRFTLRARSVEDETWFALPRPDLLVAANSRELLADVMDRVIKGAAARALPASLPEWAEVDRTAPVWALRHYSDTGDRRDATNPRTAGSRLFQSDPGAAGVTFNFDPARQTLDIHYLSRTDRLGAYIEQMLNRQFQADRSQPGVWRLKSNLREHGQFPLDLAMTMLGFGSAP
jgi:hypothetical protein